MSRAKRGPRFPVLPRSVRFLLPGLLLALFAVSLHAEVSVVTDARGVYRRTLVLSEMSGSRTLFWSQVRKGADPSHLLNLEGDRMGDSRPTVAEQPGTRQPWVVWSAGDGHDTEIAVATWTGGHWRGPRLLEKTDNPYDDRDPRLAFDPAGNPVVVWWRQEPVPRVYLSRFVNGDWTPATAVSSPDLPGHHPTVRVSGSDAVVSFYTPRGLTVIFQPLPEPVAVNPEGDGPLDGPVPPPDYNPQPSFGGSPDVNSGTPSDWRRNSEPIRPEPVG